MDAHSTTLTRPVMGTLEWKEAVRFDSTDWGWVIMSIGMAIGAGMYAVGIFCTVVVLGTQYLLHGRLQQAMPDLLSLSIRVQEGNVADTLKTLQDAGAQLVNMDVTHKKSGIARLDLRIKLCGGEDPLKLIELLESRPYVIEVGD